MPSAYAMWSLVAPFAMMALGAAPQVDAPEQAPPTAIEQALIERACAGAASTGVADADPHVLCLAARLDALRADFGRDLGRLSTAERKALDRTCSGLQVTQGREAYLDCLGAQLTALHGRRTRASSHAAAEEPAVAPTPAETRPADAPPPPRKISSRAWLLIGGTVTAIGAFAAAVIMVQMKRRVQRVCRTCGATIGEAGDLCAACRHEAADALRRAATERLEQVRTEEAERRRKTEQDEQTRQQARRDEDARLRQEEEARQLEQAARRRDAEHARAESAPPTVVVQAAAASEVFDPYTILGVPRDTSLEEIRAAYEEARSKYDQDRVAHLGADVQEHFKAKAEAVARAYQMLAG